MKLNKPLEAITEKEIDRFDYNSLFDKQEEYLRRHGRQHELLALKRLRVACWDEYMQREQ